MKFKIKDISNALEYFKYNGTIDTKLSHIEISLRIEDLDNNKVGSSMTFSAEGIKQPSAYERIKTPKSIVISMEIFPESENRPPRATVQESQVLDDES